MASRLQAIKSVARGFAPTVKPAVACGLNTSQKTAIVAAAASQEVAHAAGGHDYPWGVKWPGHSDKWGAEEPPMIDWNEIGIAFKMWKIFEVPGPQDVAMGTLGLAAEIAAMRK
eukprot:TRINITY_DN5986_c0_g2_i1.p1 TRINITY_DN5986_c0_g2~~TRINITY_DN5986_c0_g2_i1.p1  ORF type:complete len:114 (+),score=32.06 TRINITY_DN5986_c0_g2_i1:77-418(+)